MPRVRRRNMNALLEEDLLRQLIAVGPALVSELDLDVLLHRLLETACAVTAARYAALGILDEERRELERFITRGLSDEEEGAIGDPPRGRGVLGVLIQDPRPLRLTDVTANPSSSGFPAGHPPMRSFLGVPIMIRERAWGNLYLTNKRIGEFTKADEYAATTLATWAAIAVDHARLLTGAVERQNELEAAVRRLEATQAAAVAVGVESDQAGVLELVAKRGRAVLEAQSVLILVRENADLLVASREGHTEAQIGARFPIAKSIFGDVMLTKRPARLEDPASELGVSPTRLGVPEPRSALVVPLVYRGEALGVLAAFDRDTESSEFDEADEQTLVGLAASAATAVAQHA
jgi:GAF domain-containing protein